MPRPPLAERESTTRILRSGNSSASSEAMLTAVEKVPEREEENVMYRMSFPSSKIERIVFSAISISNWLVLISLQLRSLERKSAREIFL